MIGGRVGRYFYHVFIQSYLNLNGLLRGFMQHVAEKSGRNVSFPQFSHPDWHAFLWRVGVELAKEYPELECLRFKKVGLNYHCPDLRELLMYNWWKYRRPGHPESRIELAQFHVENILERNQPGLAEKMFEIAKTMPGFVF